MAAEEQEIEFVSRGTHLRLIRVDAVTGVSPQGAVYEVAPAVNIDFEPFGYVKLRVGDQMVQDGPVRMEDGHMVLDDRRQPVREYQDAVTWLVNHREFGVQFHVKGLAPGTPLPLEREFIDAVMDGTFALDQAFLARLREQEMRSHKRPVLLAAVENALVRVAMERERLGDEAPAEDPERELPSANSPADLLKRPVNAADQDEAAARAAAMAEPDDPAYAGGVR